MKQVTMVQSDLNGNIGVDCVLRLRGNAGTYGTADVDMSSMEAWIDRGTANPNDTFSLDADEEIMLETNATGRPGKYSLDDGVLKAQTDVTASVNILTEIPNKTVSFEYNAQGLRTKKTVQLLGKVTETEYILHGKLVTEMVVRKYAATTPTQITEKNALHFFYDTQSRPAKVEYDGEMYSYLHNLQGDIVGIVDAGGQVVVQYSYDAWGEPLSTKCTLTTDLAVLNLLKYRGYVYDDEIEFYYLGNRYYNAGIGRFINQDAILNEVPKVLSQNGFTYCQNSPMVTYDHSGFDCILLLDSKDLSHIGALIEDKDHNWWHYYWGADRDFHGSAISNRPSLQSYTLFDGDIHSIDDINKKTLYSGKYTAMEYFEGDFSASHEQAMQENEVYNFILNNCSQHTCLLLAKSNTKYKTAFLMASEKVHPATAFGRATLWKKIIDCYQTVKTFLSRE